MGGSIMKILLILLLLVSCGKDSEESSLQYFKNDVFFKELREDYIDYIERRNFLIEESYLNKIRTIPISFSNQIPTNAGVCIDKNHILVNSFYQDPYFNQELRQIVYHELGHCIFDLKHVNESMDLMLPSMNTFFTDDWVYRIEKGLK
jgi:beta-lactamase regulating signal transducer with metallopeptidase domain